jgi:hypothetical protein
MEINTKYFYMKLVNDEVMVNTYAIPDSTFGLNNQTDLINLLTDYFNCMVTDLSYTKNPDNNNTWDSVTYYILSGDIKSEEIYKTKNEMQQYPSYGEGLFSIYNEITQSYLGL